MQSSLKSLLLLWLLVPIAVLAAGSVDILVAATAEGKPITVKAAGGSCTLSSKDVQRRMGLSSAGSTARHEVVPDSLVPAYAVSPSRPEFPLGAVNSRLVIVDLACRENAGLRKYPGEIAANWYPLLAEATKLGYMDVRSEGDGKWGSWNLRTNKWDPEPCCASPQHSLIGAAWQRTYDRQHVPPASLWPVVWNLIQPAVWVYAATVLVCFFVALGVGHRGWSLAGYALIVLPLQSVWLVALLVVVANLYALAGMVRSGGLAGFAAVTYSSATRAWRK